MQMYYFFIPTQKSIKINKTKLFQTRRTKQITGRIYHKTNGGVD